MKTRLLIIAICVLSFVIISPAFTYAVDGVNVGRGLPVLPGSLSDGIGVHPLPLEIRSFQDNFCSSFDENKSEIFKFIGKSSDLNLTKIEIGDQFQDEITIKLISNTRDFKLSNGTLDSIDFTYSIEPVDPRISHPHTFCSGVIRNVDGTFSTTNGKEYEFLLSYDLVNYKISINSTVIIQEFEPPLKQIKNGIEPWMVKCNDGLTLLLKPTGFTKPVCVTDETFERLSHRGWAVMASEDYQDW